MNEAVSDTGPILHLAEIHQLFTLTIFERLYIPPLVATELEHFGLKPEHLNITTKITIVPVNKQQRESVLQHVTQPHIHPADAEVFILAQKKSSPQLILTDDMSLRRHLENQGLLVVGSVGILVRAYHKGLIMRTILNDSIDALFNKSSLHASPAFRAYVRNLSDNLR